MSAEIAQATSRETLELRFRAPRHLRVLCDQGRRSDGQTSVAGLPRSELRDLARRFVFVPAGSDYHELHRPRVLPRYVFFYFDPSRMPPPGQGAGAASWAPRLLFEDAALLDTALKLKRLI